MKRRKKFGFPRSILIKSRDRIVELKKKGRLYSTENTKLYVHSGEPGQLESRFAVQVYGRFHSAVQRNRVKRIFREQLRCHKDIFPSGSSVLLLGSNNLAHAANDQIRHELDKLFKGYKA
ncbi:MAG: hypothetical protein GF307_06085 [candidate division Zixibacteria bacterium]|nr:hypothetical protein [candidate division Zixibacteria bacterium]